jgi:hypothetical protein
MDNEFNGIINIILLIQNLIYFLFIKGRGIASFNVKKIKLLRELRDKQTD